MCTYDRAKLVISPLTLGQYEVYPYVHDNAGPYGHNGRDNVQGGSDALFRKSIMIDDTLPPYIELLGYNPVHLQCGHQYVDDGTRVHDLYDTHAMGKSITAYMDTSNLNQGSGMGKTKGDWKVTYNAIDEAQNAAIQKERTVKVVDTLPPTVYLVGPASNEVHWPVGGSFSLSVNDQASCSDECDDSIAPDKFWNRPFNDSKIGTYYRTYKCTDGAGLSASILRTFTIYDDSAPQLELVGWNGSNTRTFEACDPSLNQTYCEVATNAAGVANGFSTGEYIDQGATCNDVVDGPLSHSVEVSGNIVNVRVPGTYVINYDCQDLSGNAAPRIHRTVVIEDSACPKITLTGSPLLTIEAGSVYLDAGATAFDELDGPISGRIVKVGDTIDSYMAFKQYHYECGRINECALKDNKVLNSGPFKVTSQQSYNGSNIDHEMDVFCDFGDATGGDGFTHANTTNRTYFPCTNCAEITDASDNAELGDCADLGLGWKRASSTAEIAPVYEAISSGVPPFNNNCDVQCQTDLKQIIPGSSTNVYLCYHEPLAVDPVATNRSSLRPIKDRCFEETWGSSRHLSASPPSWLAAPGDFRVTYTVTDTHGNTQCTTNGKQRTVVVMDTLPPVITLHLKHPDLASSPGLIHTSGVAGQFSKVTPTMENPARLSGVDNNPYLTGPQSSHYSEVSNSFKIDSYHNKMFLAEQSASSNSWIVAAVGVAASGFAFIVYSRRSTASLIDV